MSGPPVRLQLSRARGFKLQALSLATNGRRAVSVARGLSLWGNPFVVAPDEPAGKRRGIYFCVPTAADAVACFFEMTQSATQQGETMRAALADLRGLNLACWCKPGAPCHADVLLELANA